MFKERSFTKLLITLISATLITACTSLPHNPVDISNFPKPTKGMAGIYFYQWKSGILGAALDVTLEIDDKIIGEINTGEYIYREIPAGRHKFKIFGGPKITQDDDFEADTNYFFRGFLSNLSDRISPMNTPKTLKRYEPYLSDPNYTGFNPKQEVEEAMLNITSGKYKNRDLIK